MNNYIQLDSGLKIGISDDIIITESIYSLLTDADNISNNGVSFQFTLMDSMETRKGLNLIDLANNKTKGYLSKHKCYLYNESASMSMYGFIVIEDFKELKVRFFNDNCNWIDIAKNKSMHSITDAKYKGMIRSNIVSLADSFSSINSVATNRLYFYPIINYDGLLNDKYSNAIPSAELLPSISAKELLKSAVLEMGFEPRGTLFNDIKFNQHYINACSNDVYRKGEDSLLFWEAGTVYNTDIKPLTYGKHLGSTFPRSGFTSEKAVGSKPYFIERAITINSFDTDLGFAFGGFTQITSRTENERFFYVPKSDLQVNYSFTVSADTSCTVEMYIWDYTDEAVLEVKSYEVSANTVYNIQDSIEFTSKEHYRTGTKKTHPFYSLKVLPINSSATGDIVFTRGKVRWDIQDEAKMYYGSYLDLIGGLNDITISQFILDVARLYNCIVYSKNNEIFFDTMQNFNNIEVVDITKNIDFSSVESNIEQNITDIAQSNIVGYSNNIGDGIFRVNGDVLEVEKELYVSPFNGGEMRNTFAGSNRCLLLYSNKSNDIHHLVTKNLVNTSIINVNRQNINLSFFERQTPADQSTNYVVNKNQISLAYFDSLIKYNSSFIDIYTLNIEEQKESTFKVYNNALQNVYSIKLNALVSPDILNKIKQGSIILIDKVYYIPTEMEYTNNNLTLTCYKVK